MKASTLRRREEFFEPRGSVKEYPRQQHRDTVVEVTCRVIRGQICQVAQLDTTRSRTNLARMSPPRTPSPDNNDDEEDTES